MTIEVNELSDTQEKAEETKKSGGPGKFQNPINIESPVMSVITVMIYFFNLLFFYVEKTQVCFFD